MFFWRKPAVPPSPPPAADDHRATYRRGNGGAQPLDLILRVAGLAPFRVELADLSAEGAGIRLPRFDRVLAVGERVELAICSGMRQEVVLAARVVGSRKDGPAHVRYGVEFLDAQRALAGLDPAYFRHFNRRRERRVPPSFDRRPAVLVLWGERACEGVLCDLSEGGAAVSGSAEALCGLEELATVTLRFALPGIAEPFEVRASLRHRTRGRARVQLGLEFDRADRAFEAREAELRAFVRARIAEAERWDGAGGR